MGSWNKTCGLSNLYIRSGTPVYVFVLEETTDKTNRCYSTAFWKPVLLPFNSIYNGCGGAENSSGPAFQHIMDGVASHLIEMSVGENEYHDIPVKREGFGEEEFFESVHKNRLMKKSYMGTDVAIDFVMMRKDVVDHIIGNHLNEDYVGAGNGTSGYSNCYIHYKFEDILKDMPEFMDMLATAGNYKYGDSLDGKDEITTHATRTLRSQAGLKIFPHGHPNRVSKWMASDGHRYSRIVEPTEIVQSMLEDNKFAEAESVLTEYLKGRYIDSFMESVRKNWGPAGHEGSQDEDDSAYSSLISAMTTVIGAEKAKWDAENEG